ncbi:MAG: acyloxyacyl hydrolase [Verrucomicrobiota bacterium]
MKFTTTLASILIATSGPVFAGTETRQVMREDIRMEPPSSSIFNAGRLELQSGSGAFWAFNTDGSDGGHIDYSITAYRLGVMLSDVKGDGWLRGNTELLLEGFYSSVFQGAGDWLAGGTVFLRYNFVQPEEKWIPYVQVGAGGLWNDVYKENIQSYIGQSFEVNLQASVGLRYQFNQKWGAMVEGGYRYISNFDNAERDAGLNSAGAMIGLIRTF